MYHRLASEIRSMLVVAVLVGVCTTVGCDSGPQLATVAGTVTFDGKPVSEGTVTFYPLAGGRPSIGRIQSDGTYELASARPGDGAILGDYRVTVEARKFTGPDSAPTSFAEELAGEGATEPRRSNVLWLVPERYASAETSDLTATIVDGDNVIDFKLP